MGAALIVEQRNHLAARISGLLAVPEQRDRCVVVIADDGDLRLMTNCPDWLDDYTAPQATRWVLAAMHPKIDATRPAKQKLKWN